jgi:D-ribulokinase
MTIKPEACFIGVDVGTGSARAGVFDLRGNLLGSAKRDIKTFRPRTNHVEQSSNNIWECVCSCVKEAVSQSGMGAASIKGIGFDATCSLVVLDRDFQPLTVSTTGSNDQNIIVWMDHRASKQAKRINQTGHRVLDYVGGRISPEMETPKLLWLKENLPESYKRAGQFLDLTDFLTWRATGDLSRSVCTVTCKWTYLAHEGRWDPSYFKQIGLDELAAEGFVRIGQTIVDAGSPLGGGLTPKVASELNLTPGTPVGAGLIDAHAGGVGTVGAEGPAEGPENRLAYVFGTSACTMSSSQKEAFVPGVWGPYYSAMVPGLWLSEGGQSAAGEAMARLVQFHPAFPEANDHARAAGKSVLSFLLDQLSLRVEQTNYAAITGDVIVVPEFLGNRAPFADPEARAIISGLSTDGSIDALVDLYLAGLMGLGYGLRQIIAVQTENGVSPSLIVISGGAGEHPIIKQVLADSAGMPFAEALSTEPVLLGSAMLGAVASGTYQNLQTAMKKMSSLGPVYAPSKEKSSYHDRRFRVFEALQKSARMARTAG